MTPSPRFPLFLPALLLALLAGCGTTKPARFFQLRAEPGALPVTDRSSWVLRSVRVPPYLDRSQMVLRKSEYELEVDEYHRWAEPLETGLERLLAPAPPPSEAPSWRVEVQVDRFDVDTAGTALLDARWTARPPDKGPPLEHTFRARRQAPDSTPENRAAALSALALDLKAEIGQGITDARRE